MTEKKSEYVRIKRKDFDQYVKWADEYIEFLNSEMERRIQYFKRI